MDDAGTPSPSRRRWGRRPWPRAAAAAAVIGIGIETDTDADTENRGGLPPRCSFRLRQGSAPDELEGLEGGNEPLDPFGDANLVQTSELLLVEEELEALDVDDVDVPELLPEYASLDHQQEFWRAGGRML